MAGKKQTTEKKQGRKLDAPEKQTVTMLEYEGQPVVTYSIVDERGTPSRGAS